MMRLLYGFAMQLQESKVPRQPPHIKLCLPRQSPMRILPSAVLVTFDEGLRGREAETNL